MCHGFVAGRRRLEVCVTDRMPTFANEIPFEPSIQTASIAAHDLVLAHRLPLVFHARMMA